MCRSCGGVYKAFYREEFEPCDWFLKGYPPRFCVALERRETVTSPQTQYHRMF